MGVNCNDYRDLRLPESGGTVPERIDMLVRTMLTQGELDVSPTLVLLGQYGHLGGLIATEMLARRAEFTENDTVLDLCCYVGGPARYLAETIGCHVVGLDCDPKAIALARRLTELAGCQDRVTFVAEDLYQAEQLGKRFSGIWSEASLPNSLDWLPLLDTVLIPGGKLAFSLCVRTPESAPPHLPNSLNDVLLHLSNRKFDIVYCEDMREWDIEHGWNALLRQLDEQGSFYEKVLGADWVQRARERFHNELQVWSETAGNAFFVAKKAKG